MLFRYTKAMEEITGFGIKDRLSLLGLELKHFNSLRTEEDEPIYTYNDKYMRWFVRQSIKGGRVCAFNQYYKSIICDDILKIISEELSVKRKIKDIIETYLEYKNNYLKFFEEEHKSKFIGYRDENGDEKEKLIDEKLGQLPIQFKKQIKLNEQIWDFDADSSYPSAMWEEDSIYHKIETGSAYTIDKNDEYVERSILVISHKEVLH